MDTAFSSLERFIRDEMRMSHIYQPVMLLELLTSDGRASVSQIAKALLSHDASQIEYYEQITKNMVGRVLTKNRQITDRDAGGYTLRDFSNLTPEQAATLIALCEAKIESFVDKRGGAIWSHRSKSKGYCSSSEHLALMAA